MSQCPDLTPVSGRIIPMPTPETVCPACKAPSSLVFVEEHRDRVAGGTYRLSLCWGCGVVSAAPRAAIGGDWYAKAAPLRLTAWTKAPESDWRFARFFDDARVPGKVLDLGCGDGGFLGLARESGWSGVGFDYDERVVAAARGRGLDAHAASFEAFRASRAPGEFDALTMFDVLEHAPEPSDFLNEAKRLLRPGGLLAVTLPNALRPLPWGREEHDFPPHHFTRWTPEALKGFLERHGFSIVRQEVGPLRLGYLCDHAFYYRVMPPALAFAKRLIFGRRAAAETSISELYDRGGAQEGNSADARGGEPPKGLLADRAARQRLSALAARVFGVAFLPVAWAMRRRYLQREPRCGDCLYTAARLGP